MARPGVRQTLHSVSNNVNKRASILRFYRPVLSIFDNASRSFARATRGETVPQGVRGGLRTVAWEVSASRVSIKTEFEVGLLERRKCSRPYGKGETTMRRHEGGLSGIERARLARGLRTN